MLKNLPHLWRHPRIGPKLVRNYWNKIIRGRHILRGAEFCVTYQCQLNCPHCLTKLLVDENRPELSVQEIVDITVQLADLGAIFVNYTGGEPLLREELFDVIKITSRRRDILISVASNALAFSPEVAGRLARCGCDLVAFSMDSADPAKHNSSRGVDHAFDSLINAIDAAKSESLEVWLTTILTDENVEDGDFSAMVELSRQLGTTLTVNFMYPAGNWAGKRFQYKENTLKVFRQAVRERSVRWEGSSNFGAEGCPAGSEKIYITPYGDVFPCAVLQCTFGNVLQNSLADIYDKIVGVTYFDGHRIDCLAAMDQDFIDRYIDRMNLEPGRQIFPEAE